MKHLKKFLVLLLLVPMCVHAEVAVNDKQEEINSSAISSGDEVTSANKVDGINMLFGNNVTLEGSSEYALLAGNVVNISGNVIKNCDSSDSRREIADTIVKQVTEGAIVLGVTYTLGAIGVPASIIVATEVGYIVIKNFMIDEWVKVKDKIVERKLLCIVF